MRDFVPVGNGFIGLRKFYANTAKPGRPSKAALRRPKKKAKATKTAASKGQKPRKRAPRPSGAEPPNETPASEVKPASKPSVKQSSGDIKKALHEILSDNVDRTVDELLSELQKQLGQPVKRIVVYGLLRGKDFEADGEKYRNREKDQQVA